jgi:cytochrome c5
MTEKRYTKHAVIILGASLALMVFMFVLVNHHRQIPGRLPQYRLGLLSNGLSVTDRIRPVGSNVFATAPAQPPVDPAQATTATSAATAAATVTTAARDGPEIYKTTCVVCHGAGIAGSPKLEDKEQWAKRLAKGQETLYASALNGTQSSAGVMPAKGGNPALSDAEVKLAVDFMVAQSK